MNKDLIFFGMQGSGKGTQAKILLQELKDYVQFEPGQIYRALRSNDNAIGNYAKKRTDTGNLVEDNVTIAVYETFYQTLESHQCMILDGFPRKVQQMYYFLEKEYRNERDFLAIYFEIPRDVAVQRLLERGKLEGRVDDTLEAINLRIESYLKETLPLIDVFEKTGKLVRINANQSIENIAKELQSQLKIMN